MKFFHSIRWQVQFWYGSLLMLVLLGFGFTVWHFQRANQFNRADRDLEQRMGMIARMVRASRPNPSPEEGEVFRAPAKNFTEDQALRLPRQEMSLFEGPSSQAFYYVVWQRNGVVARRSSSAPVEVPRPFTAEGHPSFRTRGTLRECFHHTPDGECLLIGRDYQAEFDVLQRLVWFLSLVGGAILLLGWAGGWWISTRALLPIRDISLASAQIANGDLRQRIQIVDPESELGTLAQHLNQTFARLQTSFERQAQFTADAAHELRTPLAVMLTQCQWALSRERSTEEYRESLSACMRATQRMRSLAENLLILARLDSSTPDKPEEACDINALVRETVELMMPLAEKRGIQLNLELAPATLCGNPAQLTLIMNNLVGNALAYNTPGGSVTIKTWEEPAGVVFMVSDTGVGIAPDDLAHIFERFYRVDKARSDSSQHTGLGLAIVKGVVEQYHGEIEVTSHVGHGSTFVVRFPQSPA